MSAFEKVLENCKHPKGFLGRRTLKRMNKSHAALTAWGLSQFEVRVNDVVLDIGCGGGKALKRLSERAAQGKLFGIDYSETSVACACKENREDVGTGKMEILHGSVSALPFPDDYFGVVTSVESYYFWPDLKNDLLEVKRVLKPGGIFAIVAEMYNHEKQSEHDKQIVDMLGMHNNTPEEFKTMMEQAGYRAIDIRQNDERGWICVICRK